MMHTVPFDIMHFSLILSVLLEAIGSGDIKNPFNLPNSVFGMRGYVIYSGGEQTQI